MSTAAVAAIVVLVEGVRHLTCISASICIGLCSLTSAHTVGRNKLCDVNISTVTVVWNFLLRKLLRRIKSHRSLNVRPT